MTDSPSSRFSAVVIMLGDLIAFWASFLILGDVIAAGALGIVQFYVLDLAPTASTIEHFCYGFR